MGSGFYGRGMVPVLPKSVFTLLPPIVLLACSPGGQLDGPGDGRPSLVIDQKQVHMVRRDHVVENT